MIIFIERRTDHDFAGIISFSSGGARTLLFRPDPEICRQEFQAVFFCI
jgi:hypothetical protein